MAFLPFTYTYFSTPDGSYSDGGNSKLTDGILASGDGGIYAGWDYSPSGYIILLALSAPKAVGSILVTYADAQGASGVAAPGVITANWKLGTAAYGAPVSVNPSTSDPDQGPCPWGGRSSRTCSIPVNARCDSIQIAFTHQAQWVMLSEIQLVAALKNVSVVTSINNVPTSRKVRIYALADGSLLGEGVTAGDGTATISVQDLGGAVMGTAYDDYGDVWHPSQAYGASAKTFPSTPNAHWYQSTGGGTSGAVEPVWPTTGGSVTDGSVVWQDMGTMRAPQIQGPYVP